MKYRGHPEGLRGSFAALLTPFAADGALDLPALRSLAQWQRDAGSHGLSVGGSTAEPGTQTVGERIAVMKTVAEVAGNDVAFIPATGALSLTDTMTLTAAAQDLGADAALVITPYYARPTQQGLYEWYSMIAREFPDLPLVLYNVPSRTAVDLQPSTVLRLRRDFANIVGIKETTREFEHFSHVLHLCGQDFMVWSGIELLALPLLALGGAGFISALTNLAPSSLAEMYEHWEAGRIAQARDIHFQLHPLADLLFVETNPAPAKWVLQRQGRLPSDRVRPPLSQLSDAGRESVQRLLGDAQAALDRENLVREPA
jgi:4-hydroxy-tetrahydrodipicolinate synthase